MTIAINSTPFIKSEGNDFFYNYFVRLALSKPEHQFIFITAHPIDKELINSENIKNVVSSPRAGNYLMRKIWLDYTLPAIVRKHAGDILIHTDGACAARNKSPQCLIISDLGFLYLPQLYSKPQLLFFKKNMRLFLHKANSVVSASPFLTREIIQHYSIEEKKVHSFQLTAGNDYKPLDWNEKDAVKEKYSDGKEYFLFSGQIHTRDNLLNLLKAFSFFKKRQKSNMQLLVTTGIVLPNDPFMQDFKSYKYRSEVKILTGLPDADIAKITGAAYAFIYPALYAGMAIYPLRAMQCGVPVVTSNIAALGEALGDAAVYADPSNFEDIADKMMVLFKDETKRAEFINKGRLVVQKINEANEADKLWNILLTELQQR